MNNENVVDNSLVTQQPIPLSDLLPEYFSKDYKDINFCNLLRGLNHDYYNDPHHHSFVHLKKDITFQDYVGRQFMTGNELLYYLELAKKLREIDHFPVLKSAYKADETIESLEFIDYFHHYVKACHKDFKEALDHASTQINQLIDCYGQKRFTPILNHEKYQKYQRLMIHGVEWPVKNSLQPLSPAQCIDPHRLFNISQKIICVYIEEVVPEMPFVAVRICKKWGDKGYVKWYSLDTGQVASKRDINRWKKLL